MENNVLVSREGEGNTANPLTLLSGSVTERSLKNARYSLEREVHLYHDVPWVIEWSGRGNWSGMLLSNMLQSPSQGLTYLFCDTGSKIFAFGEYTGSWNGNPNYYDKSFTYYQLGEFHSTDPSTFYGALHQWCPNISDMKEMVGFEEKEFIVITPLITSWNNSVGQRIWDQDKKNIHGHVFREYC